MALMYKRASRHNASMRDYLQDVTKTIQFATAAPNVSRYLRFHEQQVSSATDEISDADMTIRFVSAQVGFNVLWTMASGKDKNAFMRAIQDKQVTVEGDPMQLMWFQKSMKFIR